MADTGVDVKLEAFRTEVREWLEKNHPESLRKPGAAMAMFDDSAPSGDQQKWKKALGEKGWTTPTWPKEYGGGGLTAMEARVLQQEMAKIGAANPIHSWGMGITMIGPTILDYGTEAQKKEHIPPIIRGERRWCVGYSEPGAGSDLASVQTKCEDAGDYWNINGSKIWTSGANLSDWCGALVRTDFNVKKHDGISFMLIDMHQPAVETKPIKLMAGPSPFCETFFTNARAEKTNMLGEMNKGWTVGKRLLQHERASQTGAPAAGPGPRQAPISDVAKKYVGVDGKGKLSDRDLRIRLAEHMMGARAHQLTLGRVLAEARSGSVEVSNASSTLKNAATGVAQARAELTLEIMGNRGGGWEGAGFTPDELQATRAFLTGKAMSIYGGSAEIQNNIISKRILGLPDTTGSA